MSYYHKGLTRAARRTVATAITIAGRQGCTAVDTGHLLLAMLQTGRGTAVEFLRRKQITVTALSACASQRACTGRPLHLRGRDLAPESRKALEFAVLGAFLDIIQNYAVKSMDSDLNAYSGIVSEVKKLSAAKDKRLVFAEEDVCGFDDEALKGFFGDDFEITCSDDADVFFSDHAEGVIVSYVVYPSNKPNGSFCYKMLIDPSRHELYFFKKHRISKKAGASFLEEDLKKIAAARK